MTKEQLYTEHLKLIDALPIKKIPEARARKKKKSTQKVRKKAKPIHRRKCRQKQYADERRAAKTTDIEEGDKVLLGQRRETKLSPHFEPNPYRVIEKDGNAIVIQDAQGQTKMRKVGQMKKFVEAEPVVMSGGNRYLALRRAILSIILVTRRSQRLSCH